VIYASDLAEQRIKHEITEDDTKPVAYRVTHIHDVIDLPDDS
jgi:hypothetical protein